MRVTQFSNLLSVLATQSSKLLNINGQHGCSNTELYLCSSVSTAQSEISSVLQLHFNSKILRLFSKHFTDNTFSLFTADSRHLLSAQVPLIQPAQKFFPKIQYVFSRSGCLPHPLQLLLTHFECKQRDIV